MPPVNVVTTPGSLIHHPDSAKIRDGASLELPAVLSICMNIRLFLDP